MAKHVTNKRTAGGKHEALRRRAVRVAKYATRELDLTMLSSGPRPA